MNTKEKIAVMQAFLDGKDVQFNTTGSNKDWAEFRQTSGEEPTWNWNDLVYRVKPEPLAFIDIVFDGPPGPEAGRFIEVEDPSGSSIIAGEWIKRGKGLYALRITPKAFGEP